MCGIVGFIGQSAEKVIVDKLKKLEYRGYDSSGIAVKTSNNIDIFKAKGEIKNLEKLIENVDNKNIGIGHTRWATHGKPDEINAHPHSSNSKGIVLCHNGIIENYLELKEKLIKENFTFYSETDTESVANLLEYNYNNCDFLQALKTTCKQLKGSFSLVILNKNEDRIYFAKSRSPLYISKNGESVLIASDVICFCGFSDAYYELTDGIFGYVDNNGIYFYNADGEIKLKRNKLNVSDYNLNNSYEHFMLKEIYDTKKSLKNLIQYYEEYLGEDLEKVDYLKNYDKVKFVGCGTAYHACLVGANMLEKIAGIEARCYVGSEFRYNNPILDDKTLVVLVSQSGETADTLGSFFVAKERGAGTLAVVNVEYSTLAKNCDYVFPIKAGVEIAVASTKAYSSQLLTLYILSNIIKCLKEGSKLDYKVVSEFQKNLTFGNENDIKFIADILKPNEKMFMIGRGVDYYTALEASLKIKETSYVNSDTYYAGELKHGFLALIDNNSYVVVFATDEEVLSKTLSNAEEAKSRGAKIILFTTVNVEKSILDKFFYTMKVEKTQTHLQCIQNIVVWQLIAYYISTYKMINPDKPRNLAKSVTVE